MSGRSGHDALMLSRSLLLLVLSVTALACSRGSAHDETIARLEELERRLEEGRELEKNLPALEREVAAIDAQVEQLGAALVSGEADALERLRSTLERCGFGVVDLQSRGASTVEGVRVLRLTVEAVAPFDATSRAFEALTMQPLLVIVEELSMRRDGELARLAFTARLGLIPDSD